MKTIQITVYLYYRPYCIKHADPVIIVAGFALLDEMGSHLLKSEEKLLAAGKDIGAKDFSSLGSSVKYLKDEIDHTWFSLISSLNFSRLCFGKQWEHRYQHAAEATFCKLL
jgi:hypothetical protein